jgi:DNA polymerase
VDAKELLRRYLEQRRELGESEFMLDGLTVEEAMRLIGVSGALPAAAESPRARPAAAEPRFTGTPAAPRVAPEPPPRRVREATPGEGDDWRAALTAAGVAPASASKKPVDGAPPPVAKPRATTEPSKDEEPAGPIIVGAGEHELFTGAIGAAESLEQLAALIRSCQSCRLYEDTRNAVPGEGNPHADFVVVGEAPGATEDETGRPFVGRSGDLLTQILAAIQLPRDEIFICNVIKHRPPGNRNPSTDEIAACRPFLLRQLELLRPKVILAVGTFAAQALLDTKIPIGKLRGFEHSYYGVPLVATYHPAALLRNPAWKRPTWEDVQFARRILDRARADA